MGLRRWWRQRPRTVVVPLRPVVWAAPDSSERADNWEGGHYELSLEYAGPDDAVDRLALLVQALGVEGSRGHVRLPNGIRVVCGVSVIAQDEEWGTLEWVVFFVPLGALGRAVPDVRAYPFDEHSGVESLAWREPIDTWLVDAARQVFATAPFRLGLVGHECSMVEHADELSAGDPASPREFGYLIPDDGGLRYLPAEF